MELAVGRVLASSGASGLAADRQDDVDEACAACATGRQRSELIVVCDGDLLRMSAAFMTSWSAARPRSSSTRTRSRRGSAKPHSAEPCAWCSAGKPRDRVVDLAHAVAYAERPQLVVCTDKRAARQPSRGTEPAMIALPGCVAPKRGGANRSRVAATSRKVSGHGAGFSMHDWNGYGSSSSTA